MVSALSSYVGAGIAVRMFDRVDPLGVVWWRLVGAAVVLVAWRRPWKHSWTRRQAFTAIVFGLVTALLNTFFYLAIHELPLGTAVAIEFSGPIAVGFATARNRRNLMSLCVGALGVVLLAGLEFRASRWGLVFIFAAATFWAGYILLGKRVADGGAGLDGLALGIAASVALLAPVELPSALDAFDAGSSVVLLCLAIGVLSTVIPYGLDQMVLAEIGTARFAVLLAILPATGALLGAVMLAQLPSLLGVVGILLVIAAVAIREPTPVPLVEIAE